MMQPNEPQQPEPTPVASARSHPAMEKIFYTLINAWCWLRVAASPTLIGVGLGIGAWYFIGGPAGLMAGGALALLGLYAGIRLATYAQRADQLVEFAHGMSPTKNRAAAADERSNADPPR